MMLRHKQRWLAVAALSVLPSSATFAQVTVSTTRPVEPSPTPVFKSFTPDVVVTPPAPPTTVTTLPASHSTMLPLHRAPLASAPTSMPTIVTQPAITHPMPQPAYMLNQHFGYYPTQWRSFPASAPLPTSEPVWSPVQPRETFIPIPPPTPLPPTPMVIPPTMKPPLEMPPTPKPMMPDTPPAPKPMVPDAPPKLFLEPPPPPKPLLLDTPKPDASKMLPAGGPLLPLNPNEPLIPADLQSKLMPPLDGPGFADHRVAPVATKPAHTLPVVVPPVVTPPVVVPPVVTPPMKLATLGRPKVEMPVGELPIIRSGIKADEDTQRPAWPVIRQGSSGK